MKVRIEDAPRLIETLLSTAENAKEEWERWMMRADTEANPEAKRAFEKAAASEMKVHNGMMSDADDLIRQFEAAGGSWKRKA
jgi:hypothetical protein